jgi:hypothetical protein
MGYQYDQVKEHRPRTFDAIESGLFDSLVGQEYDFYGVDTACFALGVGEGVVVFEAIEDPDDGYRSHLDTIIVNMEGKIFFRTPIARVRLEHVKYESGNDSDEERTRFYNGLDGYRLVDVEDPAHIWLYVGTENLNDYYPGFIFSYEPKPPPTKEDDNNANT